MEIGEKPAQYPPLTADRANKIIFGSFPLSQGSFDIQNTLFAYIHITRSDWFVDNELLSQIKFSENMGRKAARVVMSPNHAENGKTGKLTEKDVYGDLDEAVEAFVEEINADDHQSKEKILRDLAEVLIGKDYHYLIEEGGRPRAPLKPGEELTPYNDPFHSNFIYHAVNGNKVRVEEFDEMFGDLRRNYQYLLTRPDMEETGRRLEEVAAVYKEHHPQEPVAVG